VFAFYHLIQLHPSLVTTYSTGTMSRHMTGG